MSPIPPQTLVEFADLHGLPVRLGLDADHGDGPPAVLLTVGRCTAAIDADDPEQRDALRAARDVLDGILAGAEPPPPPRAPWRVSNLHRDEDTREVEVDVPDELVCTDNVMTLQGERVRIVWASHYARTLFVRPEPA